MIARLLLVFLLTGMALATPLDTLLLRARAEAWAKARQFERAEELYRQAGDWEAIVELHLARRDYEGASGLLANLAPERQALLRAVIAGLQGQPVPATSPVPSEPFPAALMLGTEEAWKKALAAELPNWQLREAERRLFQLAGKPAVCQGCGAAAEVLIGEKIPACANCRNLLDDPAAMTAWVKARNPDPKMVKLLGAPPQLPTSRSILGSARLVPRRSADAALLKAVRKPLPRRIDLAAVVAAGGFQADWSESRRKQLLSALREPGTTPGLTPQARDTLQIALWLQGLGPKRPELPILAAASLVNSTALLSERRQRAMGVTTIMAGSLSDAQVEGLRETWRTRPDDLFLRCALMGAAQDRDDWPTYRSHARWLIARHSAELYQITSPISGPQLDALTEAELLDVWCALLETHPSAPVLAGMAQSYHLSHPELSEALLLRCLELEPGDTRWQEALGQHYQLHEAPAKALVLQEKSLAAESRPEFRQYKLTRLVDLAFAAGETAKAEAWANELLARAGKLKPDWNTGNALHKGHLSLGRIALAKGDLTLAKEHLLAAGRVEGTPQLKSFGPNMALAQELLEKGEREVVLQYLELCGKFWTMGGGQLDEWMSEIRAGRTPDFGANLNY